MVAQWSDFAKFAEEVKKMDEKDQPFALEISGKIINMSLPSEEKHFGSCQTHHNSPTKQTLRTTHLQLFQKCCAATVFPFQLPTFLHSTRKSAPRSHSWSAACTMVQEKLEVSSGHSSNIHCTTGGWL